MSKQATLSFEEVRWKLAEQKDCPDCVLVEYPTAIDYKCPKCGGTGKVRRLPMLSQECSIYYPDNLEPKSNYSSLQHHPKCLCRGTGYIPTPPDLSLYLKALAHLNVQGVTLSLLGRKYTAWNPQNLAQFGEGATYEEAAARLVLEVAEASK